MKHKLLKSLLCLFLCWSAVIAYIGTQDPKFWWNDEWAGMMLRKGGYRSWSMRFCDGRTLGSDGKWKCVIIQGQTNMMVGRYWWPRFSHVDMRGYITNLNSTFAITNGFSNTRLLK